MNLSFLRFTVLLALVLAFPCLAQAVPNYTVLDLGTIGGSFSDARAINNSGSVVGYSTFIGSDYTNQRPFLYDGFTTTQAQALGGRSYAWGINDINMIVGSSEVNGDQHAYTNNNGVVTDIGTIGGKYSSAFAVSNSGHVVGYSTIDSNSVKYHAFEYSNGTMRDIGTLGGNYSDARGINEKGVIAGGSYLQNDTVWHAFLYDSTFIDIGTLGGRHSMAFDVNDKGQAVGYSEVDSSGNMHGFIYSDGLMKDVGSFGGYLNEAQAINNLSQVVGFEYTENGIIPYLYEDGIIFDINELVGDKGNFLHLNYAGGINDSGQIVGFGSTKDGLTHAFLASPVHESPTATPEPGTMLLMGVGAAGAAWMRRRKMKNVE